MSEFPSHELISAYVDNQLSAQEREEVDALLESSAEARAELESYQKLSSVLKTLPAENASEDLASRVIAQAERQSLLGTATSRAESSEHSKSNRRWTISMASFLATAALLFIALTQFQPPADRAELVATNESAESPSESVSDMELLSEVEMITAELSDADAGMGGAGLPELMDAPDRFSVEFGDNGLLKLINPQNLKTAEIGDTVEGWRFDEDRVVVVQLTVVDRDQVLNSMQVLLSDLSIPYESGAEKSAKDENGDFYAVYVEADSEKMTTALRELQEDMNIGEMLVSANVNSNDLNPYFKEQGYAYVKSGELNKTKSATRFSIPPEPAAAPIKPSKNQPASDPQSEKPRTLAATAPKSEMDDKDTASFLLFPPPPPLPERMLADDNVKLSIAKTASPESYRQLQLRLPEAVANQMIYRQQSDLNGQIGPASISNGFATDRAEELKKLNTLNKPSESGNAKPPAVAGRESGQKESSLKRKLEANNSPVPLQILFVLTPQQPSTPPAGKVPNRK